MHRYMLNPTDPDDQEHAVPHGFTSGRHGFVVAAPDPAGARAARVRRLDANGGTARPDSWADRLESEACLALRDDAGPWGKLGPGTPLPGGGVRL